jgi:hypothetical protein
MAVDWALMRGQFEMVHESVGNLAKFHGISTMMVELAIKDGEWSRIESDNNDTDPISERTLAYVDGHKALATLMFTSIEVLIMQKCKEMLLNDMKGDNAATQLKIISEVMERHRPESLRVAKDGGSDNQLQIRIMSQAGTTDSPSVSAVEITGSAGKSNGVGAIQVN